MFLKKLFGVVLCLFVTARLSSADLGDITSPVDPGKANINEEEVEFIIYQNSETTGFQKLAVGQTVSIGEEKDIRIIIHGYAENPDLDWVVKMKDAFLSKGYVVIVVDWSKAAVNYELGADNVKQLGLYVGQFIIASGLEISKIEIVGSCLGAHAAGHAGKYIREQTPQQVPKIFALDTAAKKFELPEVPEQNRLSRNDAIYVVLIHTDCKQWGYKAPIGLVDFYVNGGNVQPGCVVVGVDEDVCSHVRANYVFIESIMTEVQADEVTVVIKDGLVISTPVDPSTSRTATFGEQVEQLVVPGSFVLQTQAVSPFLQTTAKL
ncbi:phospholipase A1-like [Diabrotica virgifera virgifera]|uniref:Lipase domain-containing protein n=1 Tax=Diabrotica virgifera virgifera TaxID=50390 RepID=A0ABM5JJC4_DIAVI|nr:phospholipase A1-like [Diabrotica virgifera virgifera]